MTKPASVTPKKVTPPPRPEPVVDITSTNVLQPSYMNSGLNGGMMNSNLMGGSMSSNATNFNMSPVQNNQIFPLFPVNPQSIPQSPIQLGVPNYLNSTASGDPYYLPDGGGLADVHQASLGSFKPNADKTKTDTTVMAVSGRDGSVQYTEVSVSAGGEEGAMQMHDTLIFDPTAAPADVIVQHKELDLPPKEGRTNPYPIQFSFEREISYADKKGRILHMEFVVTMGFSTENWYAQAGIFDPNNKISQWNRLRYMKANEASATFLVDGHGLTENQYLAFASADGSSIAFDDLLQALYSGDTVRDFDLMLLLPPEMGAGLQFSALYSWLERVDYARWKAAHPDKKWWQKGLSFVGGVGSFIGGLGKSVYNNTVGAVIQAGLQLADMQRLWTTIWLRKLGVVDDDYIPEMWSDMGKAAEQGQGTQDLIFGMGKTLVLAPYRFIKAVQNGDPGAAGEALGDTVFAAEAVAGVVRAAPRMVRAGARGLGKVRNWRAAIPALGKGLRDFHTNLRTRAAARMLPPVESAPARLGGGTHTMAGTLPPGSGGPRLSGRTTPTLPGLAQLDASHYQWMDQMRAATRGEAPEPPAWKGDKPELDTQGTWSGSNPAQAYAAYREALRLGNHMLEAIMARDRNTGRYHVMLGKREGVSSPATLPGQLWDTVVHYHPNLENVPRYSTPAPHDVGGTSSHLAESGLPADRPHIEFVESTLNGKSTRTTIVVGEKMYLELSEGMQGAKGPVVGSERVDIRYPQDYQNTFWRQQSTAAPKNWWNDFTMSEWKDTDGTRCVVRDSPQYDALMAHAGEQYFMHDTADLSAKIPKDTTWTPPESQEYRAMMVEAAAKLEHPDIMAEIIDQAPEKIEVPKHTQSGMLPEVAAPSKPLTQKEIIALSPPGSAYHSLTQMGMSARFTKPIAEDDPASSGNFRVVQSVAELRELMKKSKLAGGFADNGGALDPTMSMEGESYWLIIQAEKGQLWLVPSFIVEKAAAETMESLP